MIELLVIALKSTLILGIGIGISYLKWLPAYVRHMGLFLAILSLPLILITSVIAPDVFMETPKAAQLLMSEIELPPLNFNLQDTISEASTPFSLSSVTITLIIFGIVNIALLANWAMQIYKAANWVRRTTNIQPNFRHQIMLDAASRKVHLKQFDGSCSPLTWGVTKPVIVVPYDWKSWSRQKQEMVIAHELAHTKRFDTLTSLISGFISCCFWFNPLMWIAYRRLLDHAELSCDDTVINQGISTTFYATQLVTLARNNSPQIAPAMASPSKLSGRINALLNENTRRKPMNNLLIGLVLTAMFIIFAPIGSINARANSVVSVVSADENVLKMDDGNYKLIVSAQNAAEAKEWKKAEGILDELSENKRGRLNATELANILNTYAFIHYSEGKYEKSIDAYKQIINIDNGPTSIIERANYSLAQLYLANKNWQEGVDQLLLWMESTNSTEPHIFNMLAQGYYQLNNYDKSFVNIDKAISMTDDKSKVKESWWGLRRFLYWEKKNYAKAEEDILNAYKYYPGPKYEKQLMGLRMKLANGEI